MGIVLLFTAAMAFVNSAPLLVSLATLTLLASGVTLIVVAKVSVIRQKKRISWGSRAMTKGHRRAYRLGYILFGVGLFMSIALFLAIRLPH